MRVTRSGLGNFDCVGFGSGGFIRADSSRQMIVQSALTPALYIVQADALNTADKSVVRVNAKVEQEFEIIHSVSAYLTPRQLVALRERTGMRVYANHRSVRAAC